MKMPLDLKTKESRIFILTAVAAVLALVFYFRFLIQPQAAGLVEIFSKTGSISSEIRSARSEIERIDGFKRDLDKYKETVEKYEKKLPVEHEIPTLLQSLSDMAKTSSIKILSITPTQPQSRYLKAKKNDSYADIYQEIPIRITAKSGYHELGQFLNDLENAGRFMKITDIEIKSNSATPRKHDVELVVSTFILSRER